MKRRSFLRSLVGLPFIPLAAREAMSAPTPFVAEYKIAVDRFLIDVFRLSAINANLGTITAGSVLSDRLGAGSKRGSE